MVKEKYLSGALMKPYMVLPKRLMRGIQVVLMMDRKLYVSSLLL
jgi:hypothetical protein